MSTPDAALSGTFAIGGTMQVNRLGFGAMRITGEGIWGAPKDGDEARATLRRLMDLNVDFIDTAEAYGQGANEALLGEALAPMRDHVVIATKFGFTIGDEAKAARPSGLDSRPEHVRAVAEAGVPRESRADLDPGQSVRVRVVPVGAAGVYAPGGRAAWMRRSTSSWPAWSK